MADFSRPMIVHTQDDARAALEAAAELSVPATLQSAPDAIFYAGSLYLLTMFNQARAAFPDAEAIFILDAADAAAEAIAAMQMGHTHLRSAAPEALRTKLADIAAQLGVTMVDGDFEALDFREARDAKAACKAWLAAIK